ncbi:MAG TPA: AMP-binding protein, partial [Candidatus Binataceae bacterium]|nr:AMP-binding protein [Candidatus Binataceae bacterium]
MPRLDGLVAALPQYLMMLRSQYWTEERLRAYVAAQLEATLGAGLRIPFYRERFGNARALPDLPILARREVPRLVDSVRALHPQASLLASGLTSGSTGTPVSFFFDRAHQASRFAARARYLRENGWNPFQRNFWIVSTAMESPDLAFVQRGRILGIRFMSHLTDMEVLADAVRKIDPVFLYSYPVNLDGLARIFETRGHRLHSLQRIFSGSEVLEAAQRDHIRRVFGVEISDNYGSTEAFPAWECPAGSYHINAEHVIVEVVDEAGAPAAPGTLGRVLVTTLQNRVMPLIRYEIGDYAVAPTESRCRCGRTLPTIGAIAGRDINLFFTKSGKLFSPWPLFRPMLGRTWITQ